MLLFLAVALLLLVLVGGSMGKAFRDHFNYNLRPHLGQYLQYIQRDIGIPPDRIKAAELARKLNINIHVVNSDGNWSSNEAPLDYQALTIEKRFQQGDREYGIARLGSRDVLVAHQGDTSLYFELKNPHRESSKRGYAPLLWLLLVLLLLYYLTQRMIRPVTTLIEGVRRFGQGELDHRIDIQRRDELGELASNFNEMAGDIQQMLDAKRQLLLAISHELRSPLTRAMVSLELMDADGQRHEIGKDLVEMERLIEEILETERLSTSHRVLNKQSTPLYPLIEEVLQDHFARCDVELLRRAEPFSLDVDPLRIKLLLKNLLENALRHTPRQAKPPVIEVQMQKGETCISVQDSGEGVAPQHIPFLTEPFYRGDASRRRETGGYGLGLYLCRIIAEAHGGSLTIVSEVDQGTTVDVRLPC